MRPAENTPSPRTEPCVPSEAAARVLADIRTVVREALAEGDFKTALKGLELEGKHLGLFRERAEPEALNELVVRWGE